MTYEEWEADVPSDITRDTLWRIAAYRLSLFLADLARRDTAPLFKSRRTEDIADQLLRATRKISACIAEGYSRDSGKSRSIYYEYALGSARESRDWYFKARPELKPEVITHRLGLYSEIIRLSLAMISNERNRKRRPNPPG